MPNFNPLVLRGRDVNPHPSLKIMMHFNPLALRGRDGCRALRTTPGRISIHSPCAGETANSSKSHLQKLSILYNLLLPDFRKNGFREKKALCRRAKRTNIECEPRGNQM